MSFLGEITNSLGLGSDLGDAVQGAAGLYLAWQAGGMLSNAGFVSASTASTITTYGRLAALSYGAQAIAGKPSNTAPSFQNSGALVNDSSNVAPLPVVYGTRRIGGNRVFMGVSGGSNEYLTLVLALCEGEIGAINTVYIDDVDSADAKFSGLVTITKYTGTPTQAADPGLLADFPTQWTTNHTGSGVAYVVVKLKYSQSVFSGLPTITVDVQGKKVFDPRTGLTAFSANPALCVRDYLTNTIYGRGIDASFVDDAAFTTAANYCEAYIAVPGGTQMRYTCDGVVDVSQTAYNNMISLLTSCRGMLVYSGGLYKLRLDGVLASTFSFTEDNITGKWSIAQSGRRSRFNRVSANYFNPANKWSSDIAVSDSSAYRSQDNSLLLQTTLDLPFTADAYRAQQLAGLHLKQSRFGVKCSFTAFQSALRCEVGDVVTITHSTPGWSGKLFRVMEINILDSDEVEIVAGEYDATVYNLDTLTAITSTPTLTLPDPFSVGTPGAPTVVGSLYQTTGSAGVKAKATASWLAVNDAFVTGYRLEYKLLAEGTYRTLAPTLSTSVDIADLPPGTYNFRLCCTNALGVVSAYSPVTTKELLGLTAPPVDLSGFSITKVGGVAMGSWSLSADLDVRIGGRIVVRHCPLTTGATWNAGVILAEFNGDAVSGLLPLITGTYMIKAKDSSGNFSTNAVSFVATEGMVTGFTTVANLTQAPIFAGAKSNVALVAGALQLDSASLVDAYAGNIDDWPLLDSIGGVSSTGTYAFTTYMDFVTLSTRRLEVDLQVLNFDTADLVDSRTALMDAWSDFDGSIINDCNAVVQYATTNDDPAGTPSWGAWTPFFVADVTCRAVKYQLQMSSGNPTHNLSVSTLRVDAKTSP